METTTTIEPVVKQRRGLAAMSAEKRRAIARKGGVVSQATGRGYRWTSESARLAGLKGAARSVETRQRKRGEQQP